ncbi:BI1-like protein [Tanacetum coccineum]
MSLSGTFDIETGTSGNLNPTMTESPELRWGFIRKVYAILTIQLLLTVAVGGLVVTFHPFATFLMTTIGGLACYWILLIIPFFGKLFVLMLPRNYVLRAIFTISLALATGLACFFTHGKVILEAAILTTVVVVSLTLFIFWGAKRARACCLDSAFIKLLENKLESMMILENKLESLKLLENNIGVDGSPGEWIGVVEAPREPTRKRTHSDSDTVASPRPRAENEPRGQNELSRKQKVGKVTRMPPGNEDHSISGVLGKTAYVGHRRFLIEASQMEESHLNSMRETERRYS